MRQVRHTLVSLCVLGLGCVLAGTWVVAYGVTLDDVALGKARWEWLVGAAVAWLGFMAFHAGRLRLLFAAAGRVRYHDALTTALASHLLNFFSPAPAGDFSEPVFLNRRAGIPLAEGMRLLVLKLTHAVGGLLLAGGVVAGLSLAETRDFPRPTFLLPVWSLEHPVVIGGLTAAVSAAVLLLVACTTAGAWVRRAFVSLLVELRSTMTRIGPVRHVVLTLWSACEYFLEALPFVLVARAFDLHIPFVHVMAAMVVLGLVEYLPRPPGALGIQEWLLTLAVGATAGGLHTGVQAVMVFRLMQTAWVAGFGLPAAARGLAWAWQARRSRAAPPPAPQDTNLPLNSASTPHNDRNLAGSIPS